MSPLSQETSLHLGLSVVAWASPTPTTPFMPPSGFLHPPKHIEFPQCLLHLMELLLLPAWDGLLALLRTSLLGRPHGPLPSLRATPQFLLVTSTLSPARESQILSHQHNGHTTKTTSLLQVRWFLLDPHKDLHDLLRPGTKASSLPHSQGCFPQSVGGVGAV